MSRWTHAMCDDCWSEHFPDRTPGRMVNSPPVDCCWCGESTRSGIWVRYDPDQLPCKGEHDDD